MTDLVKNKHCREAPALICLLEMDTIPCPACRTELNLSDTGCPVCLRARSKYEIARGYTDLREHKARRRRLPFIVLAIALAAGGAVYAVYMRRALIVRTADSGRSRVAGLIDEMRDPSNYAAHPVAARVPAPAAPPAAAAPAPPANTAAAPHPTAPAPAAKTPPAVRKSVYDLALPRIDPGMWAVYGRVYDLRTLRPVQRVALEFRNGKNGGAGANASSDDDGRFLIVLARSDSPGGYEVFARDRRYLERVLREADIPYAKLPASEREALIDSARSDDIHSTPLTDVIGEESQRLDVFLAPLGSP